MGILQGLREYLDTNYEVSVFEQAMVSGKPWEFRLHGSRTLTAAITENRKWDMTLDPGAGGKEELQKIQVKFLFPAEWSEQVGPLIKTDKKIAALRLDPILAPGKRFFVKNKSLYPLMIDREVLLFTLLEGETIRGIVTDFSRYDITINLKGGLPVTILRHSIYDLRNKKGRSFLKSFQEEHRDWERSPLFVPEVSGTERQVKSL
ncbi:MAG: hypothetical protein JXL84_17725 [Deltaproteobacteria bacterium]|nr:hypothetical protein [Deltaproteobacteria bacterium]